MSASAQTGFFYVIGTLIVNLKWKPIIIHLLNAFSYKASKTWSKKFTECLNLN